MPKLKFPKEKFRRGFICFVLLCFAAGSTGHAQGLSASANRAAAYSVDNVISENTLFRQVSFLSDSICTGRSTGSPGAAEAAFWITRQMSICGLAPLLVPGSPEPSFGQSFMSEGRVGRNVLGFCGSGRRLSSAKGSYVIVAAHYDNLGTLDSAMYPGADSNASGVSALLSLAKMCMTLRSFGRTFKSDVIFVALDGKQLSMAGSNHLYKSIAAGLLVNPETGKTIREDEISLMVNLDIIGGTLEPVHGDREDYIIMLGGDSHHRDNLSLTNTLRGLGMDLCYDYYGSREFTDMFLRRVCDQRVFLEHGIPSVLFTSGITMRTNRQGDTADTIDYPVLKKRIFLIFHWLERIIS